MSDKSKRDDAIATIVMTSTNCTTYKNMFLILIRQHMSDEDGKVRNEKKKQGFFTNN